MSGLFSSASSTTGSSSSNPMGSLSNDVALGNLPDDSISDITFNMNQSDPKNFLAVASWDKKVRIYEVDNNGQAAPKHAYEHASPVLCCDFFKSDSSKLLSCGADNQAKLCDLQTGQTSQIAQHDNAVRTVRAFDMNGSPMAVTGSWDKTIKYWDLRTPNPAATVTCQDRVYTMDVREQLLVVGTADRYINVINLREPTKFYKTVQSPLKWQTRVVSCFADANGFAIGSIEGRCAIQYIEEKDASNNFSFKCHRDSPQGNVTNVHAVNDISFHPVHGTFSTSGSDGTFHFWDKDAKHRLKGYPAVGGSITSSCFNKTGDIFAYAISYDWSKGFQGNTAQYPIKVMLHPVSNDECKPRPSVKKR